ncbi:MAG: NUDIX domain-containing protein [Rubrobacteraceae bacterium]|nr:NUDIX domain-containing protein [Rubrobacteraceae bacterium]
MVGVMALIEREGRLLLERRSDCGRWGMVGGAVEVDEPLGEALRREVREETGLSVSSSELFCVFSDPSKIVAYPDGNVVRVISFAYRVSVEDFSGLRRSPESLDLAFFSREEIEELDVIETGRPVLAAYFSGARGPVVLE